MSTCRCYCDAKPADWLGRNGYDFWARRESDTEWTQGFYIDGEKEGQAILDYRYILYVDDMMQEFDPTIKVPVPREEPRAEYVMPFTFHLHAGYNKISLRMAGGFRSTFYNFIFKPVGEETQQTEEQTPYQVINEWPYDTIKANRTDSGWPDDKDWGQDGKGFRFNKVGSVTLEYTAITAQTLTLQLKLAVKCSNVTKTGFWKQDSEEKTRITINGTVVPIGEEPDFSGVQTSSISDSGMLSIPEWFNIININLVPGSNTITIEHISGGYSFYMCGARLVKY